jgi:hypothetical protein
MTTTVCWTVCAAKTKPPMTDTDRLRAAAGSCDVSQMKSLLAAGADINAADDKGLDALSYASRNVYPVATVRWNIAKQFRLKCPESVTTLTQAGANPRTAKIYHNPKLDQNPPRLVAIISVQDARETKGGGLSVDEKLAAAVEDAFRGRRYSFLTLNDVRQKLRTAGFSESETVNPDPLKACKALGADAVFQTTLKDFRKKNIGIEEGTATNVEFNFTDCETGELLFRNNTGEITEARGFLIKHFISGFEMVCGSEMEIPDYEKKKN